MSDEKPQTFPPLPTIRFIPKPLVEQWVEIPTTQDVKLSLTRSDLDDLYFCLNHAISAQASVQDCLVKYSQGDLQGADRDMDAARRSSIESLNSLRQLYTSLMSQAVRPKDK